MPICTIRFIPLLAALLCIPLHAAPPELLTPTTAPAAITDADYASHIDHLKSTLPNHAKAFTIVLQKPFVVIGDGTPDSVHQAATRIVQWTVTLLKRDYFTKDPDEILDIYLFKDKTSYEKNVADLFHDTPSSPYGYYSPTDKALIMNISTGGGTLVHEIVHPFVHANFPNCPTWFNEGLASLYEQADQRDGHIVGLTNWRLPILQKAIQAHSLPSFEKLTATTTLAFYTQDRGTNYAQARYLCYYLQQHDLLHQFYKDFAANQNDDPTGYKTLAKILQEPDMPSFQKSWEKWALALTFP